MSISIVETKEVFNMELVGKAIRITIHLGSRSARDINVLVLKVDQRGMKVARTNDDGEFTTEYLSLEARGKSYEIVKVLE